LPSIERRVARLPVIAGSVPDPTRLSTPGCRFAERCPRVIAACREAEPPLVELAAGHFAACIRTAA
ncbi:MAG TPA: oligopeptide/dipeptide ABC transporter ATP-binding protein, partial [Stellaceae bacterium]|nr:oligopeptide/dipeptide ABC transporter ATP-binding protein [Stellaceae bacterium]